MKRKTKDQISNVAGLILAVTGALAGFASAGYLPTWVTTTSIILAAISGSVIGYLTGKPTKNTP